jgi:fatty acid desaturase
MVEKFLTRYINPAEDTEPTDTADKKTDYLGLMGVAIANALLFLLFYFVTGSILTYFIFWILPLLIIPAVVNRIRTFVEHYSPAGQEEANRSVLPSFLEYLLIAPYGYSYHFIHHTTASIPYYFMRKSHQKLVELGVKFEENELGVGYLRTFFKLYKTLPAK